MLEQYGEFLASHAAHDVLSAQYLAQGLAEAAQQLVASRMAEAVVDLFEMVEIQHQNGEGLAILAATLQYSLPLLHEGTACQHIGQKVVVDGMTELLHQLVARHMRSCHRKWAQHQHA